MFIIVALSAMGCTQRVEPGYVGITMTSNGLDEEILSPGNYWIYGRDRLILVPVAEVMAQETMKIQCTDKMNIDTVFKIRSKLKDINYKTVRYIVDRLGTKIVWNGIVGKIAYSHIYNAYVYPVVAKHIRSVIGKYETTTVLPNRDKVTTEIVTLSTEDFKNSPVTLSYGFLGDINPPKEIMDSYKQAKQRKIDIEKEASEQKLEMMRIENRTRRAQGEKIARVAEAEAERSANEVLGRSLTPRYLESRKIDVWPLLRHLQI